MQFSFAPDWILAFARMTCELKKIIILLWPVPHSLLSVACSVAVLLGGCSWIQGFPDRFSLLLKQPEESVTTVPVTQVRVRMIYPNETKTVGEAISYMLAPHSYRPAYLGDETETIAEKTFINNQKTDAVPLHVAMQRLMGKETQIILDRKRKLYIFRARKPGESSVVFADLSTTPVAATAGGAKHNIAPLREQPVRLVHDEPKNRSPIEKESPPDHAKLSLTQDAELPAGNREFCYTIQFRNRAMLSGIVQDYFLNCGFEDVIWKLGEPGRYADYQLLQNINIPLPKRHEDLIKYLQTRFGIKTLIRDDNRVEFYDEKNLL